MGSAPLFSRGFVSAGLASPPLTPIRTDAAGCDAVLLLDVDQPPPDLSAPSEGLRGMDGLLAATGVAGACCVGLGGRVGSNAAEFVEPGAVPSAFGGLLLSLLLT